MPLLPDIPALGSLSGLYYEAFGPEDAPTLLCLHGFSLRGDVFDRLADELANRFQLVCPDLRGCGRSAGMQGPYTVGQYADDAAGLLDWLGIGSATVLGYSMGGTVAQQFARRYPERVDALALTCTWAYKSQTPFEFLEHYFGPSAYRAVGSDGLARTLTPSLLARMGLTDDPGLFAWYKEVLGSYDPEVLLAGAEEVFAFDSRAWLKQLLVPTLVVAGTDDVIVPPYHATALVHGIRNAEKAVLDGAGHALPFTDAPWLAQQVGRFLEAWDQRLAS